MKRVATLKDPEFYFILFYNSMILWLYYTDKVEPMFVIWAYYLQSVFLGAQFVIQNILTVARRTGSFLPLKKHNVTLFFMMHYGGFHLVYIIFLFVMSTNMDVSHLVSLISYVKYTALFLLINLLLYAVREVLPNTPNKVVPNIFVAYLRIIPMHLVIMLGLNSDFVLDSFLVFMLLKMLFDFLMYRFAGGELRVDEGEIVLDKEKE